MTKQTMVTVLLFAVLVLAACQSAPPAPPASATSPAQASDSDVLVSAHQRLTSPAASQDDINELAAGNRAFALDLYQALQAKESNLIVSPYSISQALAMTYAGARGNTENQMAAALRFTLPQDRLHAALNALDLALMRPPETNEDEGTAFQLNIANSIWGQKGYTFLPGFLDVLAENYGAGLRLADFVTAPEPARLSTNQWVSDQTQDKIKDLIPHGAISSDTRLLLANAIYFKAGWQYPFEPSLTRESDFNLLDGSQVRVPMMGTAGPNGMPYARGPDYQAVALPYVGDKASMLLIVPDSGRLSDFQTAFTADTLQEIVTGLESKQVVLALPKFSFDFEVGLAQPLAGLGMPDAFAPGVADFSGMDGTTNLFVSAVVHKAFMAIDEEGTEAAAATAVVVGVTSLPVVDVELTVDRPFIFLIRDNESGSILFIGHVVDPRGG